MHCKIEQPIYGQIYSEDIFTVPDNVFDLTEVHVEVNYCMCGMVLCPSVWSVVFTLQILLQVPSKSVVMPLHAYLS